MLYIEPPCPICETGLIGCCRLPDGVHLAFACHACASMWHDPQALGSCDAIFPPHAEYELNIETSPCWATQAEVALCGWLDFICGEIIAMPPAQEVGPSPRCPVAGCSVMHCVASF